jgi:hypothetical protein
MDPTICIFCLCLLSANDNISLEHVIPKSMGGSYTIDKVCKNCNNKIGMRIDSLFCEQGKIRAYRIKYRLRGNNSSTPHELDHILRKPISLEPDRDAWIRLNKTKDGTISTKIDPNIQFIRTEYSDGSYSIALDYDNFYLDPTDSGKASTLIR